MKARPDGSATDVVGDVLEGELLAAGRNGSNGHRGLILLGRS